MWGKVTHKGYAKLGRKIASVLKQNIPAHIMENVAYAASLGYS